MNAKYAISIIIIGGAVTFLERALPFIIFNNRKIPKTLKTLSKKLPLAIMMTLIVYSYKGIDLRDFSNFFPMISAGIITVVLHRWRHNSLISIAGGTIIYMVLIRLL